MGRRIGEKADTMDAQICEYLTAEADLSQRTLCPLSALIAGVAVGVAMEHKTVWWIVFRKRGSTRIVGSGSGAIDRKPAAAVVQINKRAASGLDDHAQRMVHERMAVADCRIKNIACKTVGVKTDQDRLG